jgi:two-component system LytT family response regulator
MNINVIIVDDENRIRQILVTLLQQNCPNVIILGEADNISSAYDLIVKHKPDVIFLDIEMSEGNGFALLSKFQEATFETIFVTSYGHYAINAIKLSALDYLLKPVMPDELKTIVFKVIDKIKNRQLTSQYKLLQENLDNKNSPKKLGIINKSKLYHINIEEIIYLEGNGNYSNIYLINGDKHTVAKTLKDYEETLCSSDTAFVRVHKSYIVNIKQISYVEKGEDNILVLHNNMRLEISRRKRQELLNRLTDNF